MNTWIDVPSDSDFTIDNLPFGIYSIDSKKKVGIAIGNDIIDLSAALSLGIFDDLFLDSHVLQNDYLNDFIALGKPVTSQVRLLIQEELHKEDSKLKNSAAIVSQQSATMHLPVKVGDYTDFYSSIEHATNVGKMFRDPDNALLSNWKHIPVGYHGRSSSIIESGIPIHRPKGQTKPDEAPPVYGPSKRLDFELEMAFIIGKNSVLGSSIGTSEAEDYIFGMVLFNDWSARDIQKWEYVPLGPFMAKNFASSISPWVVTLEALEPFRIAGPKQDPKVLPYLQFEGKRNFDIQLEVGLTPEGQDETLICQSNFRYMYWNMVQQLAHHTVNGCNVRIGDMMASGTISGKSPSSYGSMLELAWAGSKPITIKDGSQRVFVNDYDTVSMRGFAVNNQIRVGFGSVTTKVLPAK